MKNFLIAFFLFLNISSFSQVKDPVKWTFTQNKISDTEIELVFNLSIDNGYKIYSQFTDEGGSLPTVFTYDKSNNYKILGKAKESPKAKEKFEEIFGVTERFFENKAKFTQKIKLLTNKAFEIKGVAEYQACREGACVSLSKNFAFKIAESELSKDTTATIQGKDTAANVIPIKDANLNSTNNVLVDKQEIKPSINKYTENNSSLFAFFWAAFLGGLIALLTPCVYPMIPMTVSFFIKNEKSKKKGRMQAIIYGISVIVIFVLIGTIVSVTLGEDFTNWLSTHWLPNIAFFVIFLIFGASFLGMFEITLPSWIVNKSDKKADKGGYAGAFFMAFTLVLVSFSCTAPIVGSILAFSARGEVIMPIVGMLGFSMAFAIPFTLFALFPQMLKGLPKSGGWLNAVKVVLGFIEIALALKFLSIADQTYHWGILDREVYLSLWIVVSVLLGMYLLGKLKFSHDSDLKFISVPRLILAIITFSFAVYMFPGLFGAPLKALSGWLPPATSQDFDINKIVREAGSYGAENKNLTEKPLFGDILHLPHGLEGYFDYNQGLEAAKKLNKPIFIDFTGHGCVNCREMENRVWIDPRVQKRLRENFVIIAMYVDDKVLELPEKYWLKDKEGNIIKKLGKKNSYIQINKFGENAQPCYIIIDVNEKLLVSKRFYDLDVNGFINFLDEAKNNFSKIKD